MKKAAVVCAQGIGDGLVMMVASHRLHSLGFLVTTYSNHLHELKEWFSPHEFKSLPPIDALLEEFLPYHLIIVENDNGPFSKELIGLYRNGTLRQVSIFYPTYEPHKHSFITSWDRVFNSHLPMVGNVARAIASLLQINETSSNNGIHPPEGLIHRKYRNRVLIHPTKKNPQQAWHKERFIKLGQAVRNLGFDVHIAVSPEERSEWELCCDSSFSLPYFPTLHELASYVYESGYVIGNDSGTGHLASNLQIPTVIIANDHKRMRLWRPGWLKGLVITPYSWIPNMKGFRLRELRWKDFISVRRVLRAFRKIHQKELSFTKLSS